MGSLTAIIAVVLIAAAAAGIFLIKGKSKKSGGHTGGSTGGSGTGSGGSTGSSGNTTTKYSYVVDEKTGLTKDIYVVTPKGNGPWSWVFEIPGGGWLTAKASPSGGDRYCSKGVAYVTCSYRTSDEAQWPAPLNDCQAAFNFITENKELMALHDLKKDSYTIVGSSAGCTEALWMHATQPSKGLWLHAPPIDFTVTSDWRGNKEIPKEFNFTNDDDRRDASPLYAVHLGMGPVYLTHGTRDKTVPINQSKLLEAKCKEEGVSCELHTYNGDHMDIPNSMKDAAAKWVVSKL